MCKHCSIGMGFSLLHPHMGRAYFSEETRSHGTASVVLLADISALRQRRERTTPKLLRMPNLRSTVAHAHKLALYKNKAAPTDILYL